ncbi:MAG: NrsF family protein [Gammaproteobacteria bacterium]
MNMRHDDTPRDRLIRDLVDDLAPVARRTRIALPTLAWCVLGGIFVASCYALIQPFRPGVLAEVVGAPRFAAEIALGLAAAGALTAAALALAVPATGAPRRRLAPALALAGGWLVLQLWALLDPALEPSMIGKRGGCVWETLVVGLPPLAAGLVMARRRWPLHGTSIGVACGLGAGLLAAVLMQLACMYVPAHNLLFHVLPGLALGGLGALAGWLFLRSR